MVFWRKKNNQGQQEQEERDEKLLHPPKAPAIEPSTDYDPAPGPSYIETENDIIEDLNATPVPHHLPSEDIKEAQDLGDHSSEGGWFSRLAMGLSKSSNRITQGLSDLLTKSKLDQEALERLEEILIEADLGPKTAAKIIEKFSAERFGQEASEGDIREALAEAITQILEPVAQKLRYKKPANGPMTILVCGVNGVGKTTTIGKMAHIFKFGVHHQGGGHSVMMAAGDTFRAAAVEQLEIWAKRTNCTLVKKDIAADAAAVAFEAYEQASRENVDILLIDTAGRLQNKKNLMEELGKIVRVLKKQDEALPHEVLLVLDATTGQNAFSQLEAFKDMVNITGLIITKLDGSARGGVVVGLADRFGVPVYAIGVGEAVEDMQPFNAREFAQALVGLVD